jgi:flavin-dependent dehydrogenase
VNRYDVVVVGGRVAGSATAMLLGRAGLRVALLERSRYGSDTVSTHGLLRAGVLQLSRWGLLDEVVTAGTPPVRRVVFGYQGAEPVAVAIRPSPGVDALYAPRRYLLDRILADAAASAGVVISFGAAVTGLLRNRDGRVCGVAGTAAGGRAFECRAPLTIGADGVRSLVARDAEAPVLRRGSAASAVLYRYYADFPAEGFEWFYGDGAAAGVLPTNAGEACVFVSTTPDRMRSARAGGSDAALMALLGSAAPALRPRIQHARPVGAFHGWAGLPGYVRQAFGPGWALVGDAGYYKDPITTHGLTDALRDAELLTRAALTSIAAGAVDGRPMGAYQSTRDRLSRRLFEVTEAVARYDWTPTTVAALLREVSASSRDEMDHLSAIDDEPLDASRSGV